MADNVKGFVEGAKMARDNARQSLRIADKWEKRDPAFAAQYRRTASAAFERAYWALARARQWKMMK